MILNRIELQSIIKSFWRCYQEYIRVEINEDFFNFDLDKKIDEEDEDFDYLTATPHKNLFAIIDTDAGAILCEVDYIISHHPDDLRYDYLHLLMPGTRAGATYNIDNMIYISDDKEKIENKFSYHSLLS
jgi:hypothetical protein